MADSDRVWTQLFAHEIQFTDPDTKVSVSQSLRGAKLLPVADQEHPAQLVVHKRWLGGYTLEGIENSSFSVVSPGGSVQLVAPSRAEALNWCALLLSTLQEVHVPHYDLLGRVGAGRTGQVFLGRRHGHFFALKVHNRLRLKRFPSIEHDILKQLDHPSIVHLHEILELPEYRVLVLDYASGGPLMDWNGKLKRFELGTKAQRALNCVRLQDSVICSVFEQLVHAVCYLHARGFCHRDLKPDNILLEGQRVVLADLGSACTFGSGTFAGSYAFMAPECLAGERQSDPERDVWALGVIRFVLLNEGRLPFEGDNVPALMADIETKCIQTDDELVNGMLIKDPNARWTLQQIEQFIS